MSSQTPESTSGNPLDAEKKPSAKTGKASAKTVMYIGPNRPYELPVAYNQVFIGGIPDFCQNQAQEKPHFASCFVPVETLGKKLAELKDPAADLAKNVAMVSRETLKLRQERGA